MPHFCATLKSQLVRFSANQSHLVGTTDEFEARFSLGTLAGGRVVDARLVLVHLSVATVARLPTCLVVHGARMLVAALDYDARCIVEIFRMTLASEGTAVFHLVDGPCAVVGTADALVSVGQTNADEGRVEIVSRVSVDLNSGVRAFWMAVDEVMLQDEDAPHEGISICVHENGKLLQRDCSLPLIHDDITSAYRASDDTVYLGVGVGALVVAQSTCCAPGVLCDALSAAPIALYEVSHHDLPMLLVHLEDCTALLVARSNGSILCQWSAVHACVPTPTLDMWLVTAHDAPFSPLVASLDHHIEQPRGEHDHDEGHYASGAGEHGKGIEQALKQRILVGGTRVVERTEVLRQKQAQIRALQDMLDGNSAEHVSGSSRLVQLV